MSEKEFLRAVASLKCRFYSASVRSGLSPDDAGEVTQETLVRLWRARDSIPEDSGEFGAYTQVVFRRELIRFLSRLRRDAPLSELQDVSAPPDSNASASVELGSSRLRIEALIDSLPAAQRDVIRLSSFACLSNSEIAEATGFSEANVRQLLSRARRRLRQLID